MKSLNQLWITLIATGVLVLFLAIGLRVYESATGANTTEFTKRVIGFEGNPTRMVSQDVQNHLEGGRGY